MMIVIACVGILGWKMRSNLTIAKYDELHYDSGNNGFKKLHIPVSRYLSQGSSPYFLLGGEIIQSSWLEGNTTGSDRHSGNYHAIVLCSLSSRPEQDLRGPLYLPPSPFNRAPTGLDLVVLDNGIAEAFSCIWQRAQRMHHSLTFLTWFTKNANLLKAYLPQLTSQRLRAHRWKVNITVFYCGKTTDERIWTLAEQYHPRSEGHLRIYVKPHDATVKATPNLSFKNTRLPIIIAMVRSNALFLSLPRLLVLTIFSCLVIGENLRLYVN